MSNILIEELMKRVDSKYRLVMIAAKRAKQINKGAPPLIQTKARKPTTISLEEITQGGLDKEELVKPTWFRDLAPEAALIEEGEEEEIEEEELEEELEEEPEFPEEEVIVEHEKVEEIEEED